MHRSIRLPLVVLSLVLVAGALMALGGCAKGASTGPDQSVPPVTPPTIELVTPAEGATVPAGDVSVSVKTTGLKFVMPSNTLVAGEGHLHVTLDDEPFKMSTTPDYVYEGVTPGEHKLEVELVQNDTKSFSPPVKQEITFVAK